jgi:diguanylate cyclase (GGDEF)-like protein
MICRMDGRVDRRLVDVVSDSRVCLAAFDADGEVIYAGGSGHEALGVDPGAHVGGSILDLYADAPQIQTALRHCLDSGEDVDRVLSQGDRVWDLLCRSAIRDGRLTGGVVMTQDVTGLVECPLQDSDMPEEAPGTDPLTGLLSGAGVRRLVAAGVDSGAAEAAVVLIDLDAFAMVNEAYGRDGGDRILVDLAQRLQHATGPPWQVGRWDGDVFVLLAIATGAPDLVGETVGRVVDSLQAPMQLDATTLHVSVSIGTAVTPGLPVAGLLPAAGLAVREAKQRGRARVHAFVPPSPGRVTRRRPPAVDLRLALAQEQIVLHFQPLVRLADRRPVGAEALVRWQHPTRGLLGAADVLEAAEGSGLLVPLGERILRQACHAAAQWERTLPPGCPVDVAVNLSRQQLVQPGTTALVREALRVAGCSPARLVVEVAETAVTADLAASVDVLRALRDLGARIALDDYGTGYSSHTYLNRFPVDTVKIDRSLVSRLGADREAGDVVAAAVAMAHGVGVRCVAEGVETEDQLTALTRFGCDMAQGYLFSRPLELDTMTAWLWRHLDLRRDTARPTPAVPVDVLARIVALESEGASLHTIAARLNMEGLRTARDKRWHHTSVAAVIAQQHFPEPHG